MSVPGIDFTRLTLQAALDLAILIEDEARERYEEFAYQMDQHNTPEAAQFFRFMADNEARHGTELGKRRHKLFKDAPHTVTRAMLFDVEAPEYDQARAFMTARQAMQAALRSEEKAHQFFVAALPQIHDADVRGLFTELRDEEIVHQELVRKAMARLPPDATLDSEDLVDEPNPQ